MELGYGRFRKIFDMMPVPAVIVRVNDPIMLDANEAFGRQMGIQAERLPGRRARDLGIGPTPDAVTALIKEVSEIGAVRNRGMTMRTASGEERQVICNLEPFEFMGESAILAISTDITDTLEMGDKLGLREQQLISIVDTAIDTIITLNSEMRVVVFNQAACQMFGVTEAQMLGESLDRVRIDELRELQGRKFMDFLESTDVSTEAFECIGRHSNGAEVPMEVTLSKAGKGANTLVTVVSRDISHQQIIAQARTAAASIEFAGKAKSTLLSQVSHELRTPLGAIIGFAQLINDETDEPIPQSQRARLNMLMKAASHLHLMLGDIQDFSLIEARGVRLQPVVVDLRSAVDSALCISQPAASERGIRLVASDGNDQRSTVLADQLRLGQVLLNLISNGIKYNRNGGSVTVSIGAEPRLVHIDVEDDGLGMTEAQVGNLFQPFNRLGREGGSIEGSGIGLVLTRRLVNLMGGEVTVRSVAGEGSCFRVTLPALSITETPDLTGSDAKEPTPIPTEFVETKTRPAFRFDQGESPVGTVLCMEDNEVTSILITQLVSRWPGVTLVMAADGTTGIEKAIALQPDVVLLDMNLPDMSGLEVLARLRGNVETRDLVVVALTASSNPDEIEAAEAVGIDGYWSKPIDFQQFFDGLRRLLAKAAAADRPH